MDKHSVFPTDISDIGFDVPTSLLATLIAEEVR